MRLTIDQQLCLLIGKLMGQGFADEHILLGALLFLGAHGIDPSTEETRDALHLRLVTAHELSVPSITSHPSTRKENT